MRLLFLLFLFAAGVSDAHPGEMVASPASILFYNGPAAVRLDNGGFAIGVIKGSGEVEISFISPQRDEERQIVHTYSQEDDHGAPALWPADGGIYVATSIHSSDLSVFFTSSGQEPKLVCRLEGRFTYPRFYEDGGLRLLVRHDQIENTAVENYRGMLSTIPITSDRCGKPIDLIDPGFRNWVYATRPMAFPDGTTVAWSLYDQRKNSYLGPFVATIANDKITNERNLSRDGDTIAWGLGYYGKTPAVSAVEFTGGYACCNTGRQVQDVLSLDGSELYRSNPSSVPYYPDGVPLAQTPDAASRCAPEGASSALPIKGDDGQVYMTLGPDHSSKHFSSSVWICSAGLKPAAD